MSVNGGFSEMLQVLYALPLKLPLLFPFTFNGKLARAFIIIAVIISRYNQNCIRLQSD